MNIGAYLPHGGSFGSPKHMPNPQRRNKMFQLAASNMFLAWAEVLGNKLEQIVTEQEKSRKSTPTADTEIIKEISAEDYFDEGLVNPNGNDCPFALQNIVCLLLLEITTFLRETYQYMPKKLTSDYYGGGRYNKDVVAGGWKNVSYFDSMTGHSTEYSVGEDVGFIQRAKRASRVDMVRFYTNTETRQAKRVYFRNFN